MIGRFVMRTTGAVRQPPRRQLTETIGGATDRKRKHTGRYEYRLGGAWDGDTLLVSILNGDEVNVGIAFEADSFDNAFARALTISKDVADEAGHLSDGVTVSLTEFGSLAEIGIDAD